MVTWNKTMNSWISLAKMEPCVPILAVKELGCALSTKNTMFKDLFESVCEQHQLCYGCVSCQNAMNQLFSKEENILFLFFFLIGICTSSVSRKM